MSTEHNVWASSFADPEDVRRFRAAKASGMTDNEAFKYGDNGIGLWMDDVSEGSGPAVALPPEVMEYFWDATEANKWREARGKEIFVWRDLGNTRWVVKAKVLDRMPHLAHLESVGSKYRIDLNPDTVKALGKVPHNFEELVSWKKVEDGSPSPNDQSRDA